MNREAHSAEVPSLPRLEIRPAGGKGRGVFACEFVRCGQPIVALSGTIYHTVELTDDMLALQIGPDLWLCSDGSLLDDMINHGCAPNAGFTDGSLTLYALRDISAGEEITWDYSTSLSEAGWTLNCTCGHPDCRGVIRSWPDLTPNERDKLRPIALRYLRDLV